MSQESEVALSSMKDLKTALQSTTESASQLRYLRAMAICYGLITLCFLVLFVGHDILNISIAKWVAKLSAIGVICLAQFPLWINLPQIFSQAVRLIRDGDAGQLDERLAQEQTVINSLKGCQRQKLLDLEERLLVEVEISGYLSEGLTVVAAGAAAVLAAYIAVSGGVFVKINSSNWLIHVVCLSLLLSAAACCIWLAGDRGTMRRLAWTAHIASRNARENAMPCPGADKPAQSSESK